MGMLISPQWKSHARRAGLPLGVSLVLMAAVLIDPASAKGSRVQTHDMTVTHHYDKSSPTLLKSAPKPRTPALGTANRDKMHKSNAVLNPKTTKGVKNSRIHGIEGESTDAKHKDN